MERGVYCPDEAEREDWGGTTDHTVATACTYVDRWYPKVSAFTFATEFYPSIADLPDRLPFPRSGAMVRWNNKSPKDSRHWGPVWSAQEAEKVFYTSLRCKSNTVGPLCVREWHDKWDWEVRCFYNNGLRAISTSRDFEQSDLERIIAFVDTLPRVYWRCVLDVASVRGALVLVEYNSWELNSGAHAFSWHDDWALFYEDNPYVVVRSHTTRHETHVRIERPVVVFREFVPTADETVCITNRASNGDVYLYNDKMLGRFSSDLTARRCWVAGDFRWMDLFDDPLEPGTLWMVRRGSNEVASVFSYGLSRVGPRTSKTLSRAAKRISRPDGRYGCTVAPNLWIRWRYDLKLEQGGAE